MEGVIQEAVKFDIFLCSYITNYFNITLVISTVNLDKRHIRTLTKIVQTP